MKYIELFDGQLGLEISDENWDYLCKYRFGTTNPSLNFIEPEFVTGTRITPGKKDIFHDASRLFADYINDLREINHDDINRQARELLSGKA